MSLKVHCCIRFVCTDLRFGFLRLSTMRKIKKSSHLTKVFCVGEGRGWYYYNISTSVDYLSTFSLHQIVPSINTGDDH